MTLIRHPVIPGLTLDVPAADAPSWLAAGWANPGHEDRPEVPIPSTTVVSSGETATPTSKKTPRPR